MGDVFLPITEEGSDDSKALRLSESLSEQQVLLAQMLVGKSPAMQRVRTLVTQLAQYPTTTVLVQGESGTGKDVVACAIHQLSRRASYPFVPINCAAIPETLLESELFGVEAGAFTDARVSREGYILRADRGTLFLDEIGSMSLMLQAKLLRFLETFRFHRVGGTREVHVNIRVVSATNVDLHSAVQRKSFRDDLFYRLKVVTVFMPPLRERTEDIEPLVEHFLRLQQVEGQSPLQISDEAMELLLRYAWPGNVRELRSVIQSGQILCNNSLIQPADLPESIRKTSTGADQRLRDLQHQLHLPPEGINLPAFLQTIEQTFVHEALELCHGNQVQAASLLGMTRDQLRYRLSDKGGQPRPLRSQRPRK